MPIANTGIGSLKSLAGKIVRRIAVVTSFEAWKQRSIHLQEVNSLLFECDQLELDSWRRSKLTKTLVSAQARSPFYQQSLGLKPIKNFEHLPVTSKIDFRNSGLERAMGCSDIDPDSVAFSQQFVHWRTSGTSGAPYKFVVGKHHRVRHDAQRAAVYLKAGVPRGAKIVEILGGVRRDFEPDFTYGTFDRRVIGYFRPDYADEIFSEQPMLLYGNGSHLLDTCRQLRAAGKRINIPFVCNSSEVLLPEDVAELKSFFGCAFFEIYGMCEAGNIAYKLPGESTWNSLNRRVLVELIDSDGRRVNEGEVGEVVVTTLTEDVAPLIRYATGDYATLAPGARNGEADIRFCSLDGRMVDNFEDYTGKSISCWQIQTPSFWAEGAISEAVRRWQVIQKIDLSIKVKLETRPGVSASDVARVVKQIKTFLSDMVTSVDVDVELVEQIHAATDGKFRPVRRDLAS